ncbi:MAG: glutamine--fructose-6-phosphate transaminase (isomerizing) [Bdellovibrio sp.]|nr:MAG: glutamine--fructose-6-phosphate transaminase (isomerizing) [Bdellovibrio sp.]
MCGIVGYFGPLEAKKVILEGLRKLEYRGYDSAGVSILDGPHFKRVRAEGKLKYLESRLAEENFSGHLGIGHTRWATHGAPSERNAHPHEVRGVSLVHNGIIENYLEIREALIEQGAELTSDTDSELVAHLIADEVEREKDLLAAVIKVLPRLRGAFSILVVWERQPDRLIAFKDGPPLIVGLCEGQALVVSDVQAGLAYTKRFVYLGDREIAEVLRGPVRFFSAEGKPIEKTITEVKWSSEAAEKQGFSHYMLKEIYEQPKAVSQALSPHLHIEKSEISMDWGQQDWDLTKVQRILMVACGTSYYAALTGKYYIEKLARIPVDVDLASEFRYREPVLSPTDLVVTISQSGETADTLAALRLAKQQHVKVLSLCNVKGSTIDRSADGHFYMNAGPEIGVASTKAFTCTLSVLVCFSAHLAKERGRLPKYLENEIVRALTELPGQLELVLSFDKYFSEAAIELKNHRGFLFMGRGVNYPMALEGALKLKELAYLHAEGYAAGEMKHGPLALIDRHMAIVMLAPADEWYEKTISNLEEAKARGGQIISIGTVGDEKLRQLSQRFLAIPRAHWAVNPILSVVPLQLMAFHLADSLGHDVDQPRNLAKSVTVE